MSEWLDAHKKINGLTGRQRKFAKRFLETGEWVDAYRDVVPTASDDTARRVVFNYRKNPAVVAYITARLAKTGLVEKAFQVQDDAMGATVLNKAGEEVPDHKIRLQAADKVLDLFTLALKTKEKMTPRQQQEIIDLEAVSSDDLRLILENHGQLPASTGGTASGDEEEAGG